MNRSHQITRARMSALAAAALAGALVLSGCNGSSDPQPSPTTTAPTTVETPTEEPTTTETATETEEPTSDSTLPELPDEAKENTPEGAEAFIRYYFDVVNLAYTKPETGLIPPLSDPECLACSGMEEQVEGLVNNSQRVKVGPFELGEMEPVGGGEPGVTFFNVELTQPANEFLDSSDSVVRESPELDKSGTIGAIWGDEEWLLYDSAVE